jgi:lipoyl synthase
MAGRPILFHTPGVRRYQTAEHDNRGGVEYVSISLTGTACALKCAHCNTRNLRGMLDLRRASGSLFELCAGLAEKGTRGVLISGGSDAKGRVSLLAHMTDLKRIHTELGMAVRVHVGLPDEETCAALGEVGLDGAMIDIIGHRDTIRDVYHLGAQPEDFEQALAWLEQYHVPTVPHIVIGLHFGKLLGEERALEMIVRHTPKLVALVVLTPIARTEMAAVSPPPLDEIGAFFRKARQALPTTPLMLGCARSLGPAKVAMDRLAVDLGFDGIAFPAGGIVDYAKGSGCAPEFVNACCGVAW